jgi:phosphoribosylformylglycinamidine cyclo-ligase
MTYSDAGVNIEAASRAKEEIKKLVRETFTENVLSDIGGFGALFRADFAACREPVLVSSVDGVGTKLKVAVATGIHHTVGYDLVAHCVNDILVQGARPLFFLDYIAMGRLVPETVTEIVRGLVAGCRESGCALVGGETAEMPDVYGPGEYDLAGFIVGFVERRHIIDGRTIRPGDWVLGLPSLGLHTNGYSLARKLLFDVAGWTVDTFVPELGCTVGQELLKPHRNYLPLVSDLLGRDLIKGLAHLTGGGFVENIPRILPKGCSVKIERGSWPVLPIFSLLERLGRLEVAELYRTFNMGIGLVIVADPASSERILESFRARHEACYRIGRVVEGTQEVLLTHP